MTSREIEIRLASFYSDPQTIVVPNASWGAGVHECDLLVLSSKNWATEIEIKVSRVDLKADLKKPHGHNSGIIRKLWFAVPAELVPDALEICPARAGIFGTRTKTRRAGKISIRSVFDFFWDNHTLWDSMSNDFKWVFFRGDHCIIGSEIFVVRKPVIVKDARQWTIAERLRLAELGTKRIWSQRFFHRSGGYAIRKEEERD